MLSWVSCMLRGKLHAELYMYKLVRTFDELDKLYAEFGKLHAKFDEMTMLKNTFKEIEKLSDELDKLNKVKVIPGSSFEQTMMG